MPAVAPVFYGVAVAATWLWRVARMAYGYRRVRRAARYIAIWEAGNLAMDVIWGMFTFMSKLRVASWLIPWRGEQVEKTAMTLYIDQPPAKLERLTAEEREALVEDYLHARENASEDDPLGRFLIESLKGAK